MNEDLASHQEIADLKLQITSLSVKLDVLSADINRVNVSLARQDGANLPEQIKEIKESVKNLETVRDSRAWMVDQVNLNTKDISDINAFRYKAMGIIILVQLIAAAGVKFLFDVIFHAQIAQ